MFLKIQFFFIFLSMQVSQNEIESFLEFKDKIIILNSLESMERNVKTSVYFYGHHLKAF